MHTLKKSLACFLVLLSSPGMLLAQKAVSDWNNVEILKPGTRIVVTTRNGREFVGEKRQSTDETLFMETKFTVQGTRTISLSRDEIGTVGKKKSRGVFTILGFGIGLGIGIAIGHSVDRPYSDDPGMGKLVGGLLGGVIGFGAGSFIARKPSIKQVYHAP